MQARARISILCPRLLLFKEITVHFATDAIDGINIEKSWQTALFYGP